MEQWIPMYNNQNYLVNPQTGKIKSLSYNYGGRILKGRVVYTSKNGKAKCVYHTIVYQNGERKCIKEHRLVAEAVLKKDLSGVSIGHKNGIMTMNGYSNLIIGGKKNNASCMRVHEFFNKEYRKTYPSIRAFERETGISHKGFERQGEQRILKRYAYTFLISEDF